MDLSHQLFHLLDQNSAEYVMSSMSVMCGKQHVCVGDGMLVHVHVGITACWW